MGGGIVVIVVAVAVGGLMVAAPAGMWWATQAWKFRHPEANEPSDLVYGMTRIGGVLIVAFGLLFGLVLISNARTAVADEHAKQERARAEAAFKVPPPEIRGTMPVVGYYAKPAPNGDVFADVYYIAPEDAVPEFIHKGADHRFRSYPCYTKLNSTPNADKGYQVEVQLIWAPDRLGDVEHAGDCAFGRNHRIDHDGIGRMPPTAQVVTDGPIANADATTKTPASAGNAVPRLSEHPPDGGVTVGSERLGPA